MSSFRALLRTAFINDVLSSRLISVRARSWWLRRLGFDIAAGARIRGGATITGRRIALGPNTYVGAEPFLDGDAGITVGADCDLGPRVSIYSVTHEIGTRHHRAGAQRQRPVHIGNGVWIGGSATVLPGVQIGDGCIIAAGAVVAHDCKPHGLYAGVPARRVRDLPQ